MRAWAPLLVIAAITSAVASCGRTRGVCEGRADDADDATCSCEASRRRPDGTCCPTWTKLVGQTCEARRFTRSPVLQNLGPAGARGLDLDVDGEGRAVMAWQVDVGGESKVVVGEESVDGRAVIVREPAAALAGRALTPSIAARIGRHAVVAWKQDFGSDTSAIFVSERSDDGAWADPRSPGDTFSFSPRAFEPSVAMSTSGEAILVWNQWVDPVYGTLVATKKRGAEWARPASAREIISPDAFYVNAPLIATSLREDGDVLVAWYQASRTDHLMTFFSERRGESGAFSRAGDQDFLSPLGADVGASGAGNPKPALGPLGQAACAWLQADGEGHIVPFLASRAPAGEWQKPTSLEGSIGERRGTAQSIQAAFGARGTLFLVWTQDLGAGDARASSEGAALFALRRRADGTWQDDPRAPVRLSLPGAKAQAPRLAVGRDGGVAVAWLEVDAKGSALRLRRAWDGNSEHNADEWSVLETLADSPKFADSPALAFGGREGNAERLVVAWTEGQQARVQVATVE